MRQFNLIDEKWIPVRFLDGTSDELGISETLLRAKEIAAIEDASPLVVAALHRFLLAVLYRVLEGPTDIGQAKQLFKEGFPGEKIAAYLEKWRDRFWLFDEKYPFGQVADFQPKKWQVWSKMAAEHNADNARVLFDHMDNTNIGSISFSMSARLLLAVQTFDLAVTKSEFVQPLDAPSARAIIFIVIGNNFHETLCFGLKWQAKHIAVNDSALWEREQDSVVKLRNGQSKVVTGYADLYTWRSRSVIFQPGESDVIQKIGFASGVIKEDKNSFIDPMLCFHKSQESGFVPMKFHEDKGFWRDFHSILPGEENQVPLVIENAISLCRTVEGKWPRGFLVCGQKTKSGQAKVDFWRMELFKLPHNLATDREAISLIRELLDVSEHSGKALNRSLQIIGKAQLTKGDRDLMPDKWVAGKLKPGDITKYVMSTDALPLYWADLETHFHEILDCLDRELTTDDIRYRWLRFVRDSLQTAWNHHRTSVAIGDAWAIRALVKAEEPVWRKLSQLNQEIRKLEPQEEVV